MLSYDPYLTKYARSLRRNMTDAEQSLWLKIKGKQLMGYPFYRQKPIGHFIVDFYCPRAKLVIELDGGQHYSPEGKKEDKKRDAFLKELGLHVLRFTDREIFEDSIGVLEHIVSYLSGKSP